jgi:carboxymethylenebutenolidase
LHFDGRAAYEAGMPSNKTRLAMPGGGASDTYFTCPDGQSPWPGVLLFMDGIGWRQTLFDLADSIAAKGYCVLVPNVFWRTGEPKIIDINAMMAGGPQLDALMKLIASLTEEVLSSDAKVYLDELASRPQVAQKQRLTTTGYCLGGGLSLCTAWLFPERVAAAMSFHGGAHVTAPEAPARIVARLKARTYLGVAEIDRRHDAEVTKKLEAAFTEAKVPHQIELYAGAAHGFAIPDHPKFERAAAERHFERTMTVLKETYAQ